ncbi:hypothetical protein WICMUC_000553 [Wickerhamomyces mucosus]|uniref:Complex 1 LYR protein domain-containing protein n=1 Tax=Wickerhamomyces mucosus TaxID=1378264 RepID=A0A9P8PYV8_9ASCO|nr:hypothetical protein WICMUC_000553 [Wickerhamomyces mucosus]
MVRLSGLQKEVLKLYRQSLRNSFKKPVENQGNFRSYIKVEFGKNRNLAKKEFSTIEYLLRNGYKKLEMLSADEIKNIK